MSKKITVALYSGVSKSTTFIERLIVGLVNSNINVLVFGVNNGTPQKSKLIKYHTYSSKINKVFRLYKYTLLVSLFKLKDKKKLDKIIKFNTEEPIHLLRLKYYPVLYYKPDIFHLQWTKSIRDWFWVQEFGMKLVVSLRGTHITISPKISPFWKNVYVEKFPKVSAFHAVSDSVASELKVYNVAPSKIHIVKSGLSLEEFKFQLKDDINKPLKIISVGRAHFTKGYNFALDALSILKEKNIKFHYTIIGVAGDEKLIYQRSQLQLQEYVTLEKPKPFLEVVKEISEADILLLPSIEEGIANVVLEAMALGTLVLSNDCGGMREVIVNNETGFLVPNRDVDCMANTIVKVSNLSQSDYNAITKKARLKIKEHHSEKLMIHSMMQVYKDVLVN